MVIKDGQENSWALGKGTEVKNITSRKPGRGKGDDKKRSKERQSFTTNMRLRGQGSARGRGPLTRKELAGHRKVWEVCGRGQPKHRYSAPEQPGKGIHGKES